MTLQEASRRFHLKLDMLQLYEENGLLKRMKTKDGTVDYPESELHRASHLYFLEKAGMDLDTLKRFVKLSEKGSSTEQIQLLRKCRHQLLEEIHRKQQSLDQLDYLIYEIKNPKSQKEDRLL